MNSPPNRCCTSNRHMWAIALFLPDAQYRIISRFRNRQDADDCSRFLQRTVPTGEFEVIFVPGEIQI